MHLEDVRILQNTRSSDGKSITAITETRFQFLYSEQWIATVLKSEVVVQVHPRAPEQKILRKLKAAAWADVCSYMNGDDVSGENIFKSYTEASASSGLSYEDEYELQEMLREAEQEILTGHRAA